METNYISKRLKLILPVFALMMLASFLVNAQGPASNTGVQNNTIELTPDPYVFCDQLDDEVTVTGTVSPVLTFDFGGDEATVATISIGWQYSLVPSGEWSTTFFTPTSVAGGTLTPVNPQTGSFTLNGVTATYADDACADIEVEDINANVRIRRVVSFVTDDLTVSAEDTSVPVSFKAVVAQIDCDDNVISFDTDFGDPTLEGTICENELPGNVTLHGSEVALGDAVCGIANYRWEMSSDQMIWEEIVGETAKNLTYSVTGTTYFRRIASYGQDECESDVATLTVLETFDLAIKGPQEVCILVGFDNLTAVYTADFDLLPGTDYDDYEYIWNVDEEYGTFDGVGLKPNKAVVKWNGETPLNEPAELELTVTSPDGCVVGPISYFVDVSHRPEANIQTADEQELCLDYGQFDNPVVSVGIVTDSHYFVGDIKLKADYSNLESTKNNGQWTKTSGPGNVIFVVAAPGYTVPVPFQTASWVQVTDTEGYEEIYAVAVWEKEQLELGGECLDLFYTFEWTEFGSGACAHSSDDISVIFYRPYDEAEDFTLESDATNDLDNESTCGNTVGLTGREVVKYCENEIGHTVNYAWSVVPPTTVSATLVNIFIPDPDAAPHIADVTVPEYGAYTFTWEVTQGACVPAQATLVVTFEAPLEVDAGADQEICNNFSQSGNSAFTYLYATVTYTGSTDSEDWQVFDFDDSWTGIWTVESKPLGAGDPTFIDDTDPKTGVMVTSLGRYVFRYTAQSKDTGQCVDFDEVIIDFYPGLLDATVETNPDEKTCSLAFQIPFTAQYDYANLSGPENLTYNLAGEFRVYQRDADGYWMAYSDFSIVDFNTELVNHLPGANTITFSTHNLLIGEEIDDVLTINTQHYGEFKVEYDVYVANQYGHKIDHPVYGACEMKLDTRIDLFWKPAALILPNNEPAEICGVGSAYNITLTGNVPSHANSPVVVTGGGTSWVWNQDFGYNFPDNWNQSVIEWRAMKWNPVNNAWEGPTSDVVITPLNPAQYHGRQVSIHATEQGQYRVYYKIINERGTEDCWDEDWQDIDFLLEPDAGDSFTISTGYKYEFCGELDTGSEDGCEGWGSQTVFKGFLEVENANTDYPDQPIVGQWQIDLDSILVGQNVTTHPAIAAIGYTPNAGTWTPAKLVDDTIYQRHDWIKFNEEYIYDIDPESGLVDWSTSWLDTHRYDPNPYIEVSRHGVFPFKWVATNPLSTSSCGPDISLHEVYFKNTPLARDIIPIQVSSNGAGELFYDVDGEHPFDKCHACAGTTQFYMLERPRVEQAHGTNFDEFHQLSGGFLSTIPATQSVRWYTLAGGQTGPVIEKPIEGGIIMRTYALVNVGTSEDPEYKLVHSAPNLNHNKHHIVEIQWDNTPAGQIRVEEENTVTECLHVSEYDVTKVPELAITGDTPVRAFNNSDAQGNLYTYTIDYVPGAYYNWDVSGGVITGGWYYYTPGILEDGLTDGKALNTINVEWGTGPAGTVDVVINHYCHDEIATFPVEIIQNTVAGQLRYWNQEETFIPTPFLLHPNNIPDYFYLKLYEVYPADHQDVSLRGEPINDGYESLVKIEPNTDLDLTAYFEFGDIDLTKSYRMKIWDGGFSYLEQPVTTDNFLSFTYTWNAWSTLGVSATDALAVIRMAGGIVELNDLGSANPYWWVGNRNDDPAYGYFSNLLADVNSINGINIVDVRDLMRRVVGDIGQFRNNTPNFHVTARVLDAPALPAKSFGDGTAVTGFSADNDEDIFFEFVREGVPYEGTTHPDSLYYLSRIVTFDDANTLMNIYYAGVGDINSKNSTPMGSGIAKTTDATLAYSGLINAQAGDVVTIPVRLSDAADISASTIGLTFNPEMIQVLETGYEFANIDNENGRVRVASLNMDNTFHAAGESIVDITVKLLSEMTNAELFELEDITEFADADLRVLDIMLDTDAVSTTDLPTDINDPGVYELSVNNYPNPFRSTTNIEYTLPESGKVTVVVYNRVGQVVHTVVSENQVAGRHTVEVNSADLGNNDGVYIYRITVEGESRTFVANGNLMLMK